ncbi:multiple sugar transport system substrate-binding protein [Phyllobacterium myrsinacearum]|uniref:ABC transporter substrate-binding protein n=1 Tax=Phyllobacterium myrsinacearum TaxID=28101 RepID=UPI001028ACA4|nr:ABC transporter substrate-binding protein [Phyllobacterium myrsinacearum]RZS88100.1 multiple sugar transport system substrate-binding protein [Phyllobacterium myrsinacearum]
MTDSKRPLDGSIGHVTVADRRQFLLGAASAAFGVTALGLSSGLGVRNAHAKGRAEISFASASFFGKETFGDLVNAFNESQDRIMVKYIPLPPPSSSTEVYQGLIQQLARHNGTPDVFSQDAIWVAGFAAAGWALPLDQYFAKDARSVYTAGAVAACTYQEKLVGLPWFLDTGMLYYRKDILEKHGGKVPETWEDMARIAAAAQSANDVKFGYLWQGKQAEVLVCDAVEIITSNSGSILAADGKSAVINEKAAVEAIQFLYDTMVKSKISPQNVLSWDEEPSRQPFTSGEAMFMRNWAYVYSIAQDPKASQVVDKVGVAPLPHFPGSRSAACLGGYQLGVNANSKQREAAIEFLTWLSSPETQQRIALNFGLAPTRPAVLANAKVKQERPFMASLEHVFSGATPRPITPKYAKVTLALQSGISKALVSGSVQAEMDACAKQINKIIG